MNTNLGFTYEHLNKLKSLAKAKHSSLIGLFRSCEENKSCEYGPWLARKTLD
jgi:hypothetical protein